jgi:hypothetical protein
VKPPRPAPAADFRQLLTTLHPKVREYLEQRMDTSVFKLSYDLPPDFRGYNMDRLLNRKIYYVIWHERQSHSLIIGPSSVLIFDQESGELLHDGTDGGE